MSIPYRLILEPHLVPPGFKYPESFVRMAAEPLPILAPWRFLCADEPEYFVNGLAKRYPSRKLVPFARRTDNDGVACFDASALSSNPPVMFIHDFADPGWEVRGVADDFEQWLRVAAPESVDE